MFFTVFTVKTVPKCLYQTARESHTPSPSFIPTKKEMITHRTKFLVNCTAVCGTCCCYEEFWLQMTWLLWLFAEMHKLSETRIGITLNQFMQIIWRIAPQWQIQVINVSLLPCVCVCVFVWVYAFVCLLLSVCLCRCVCPSKRQFYLNTVANCLLIWTVQCCVNEAWFGLNCDEKHFDFTCNEMKPHLFWMCSEKP